MHTSSYIPDMSADAWIVEKIRIHNSAVFIIMITNFIGSEYPVAAVPAPKSPSQGSNPVAPLRYSADTLSTAVSRLPSYSIGKLAFGCTVFEILQCCAHDKFS
jgi:hypothetical protein